MTFKTIGIFLGLTMGFAATSYGQQAGSAENEQLMNEVQRTMSNPDERSQAMGQHPQGQQIQQFQNALPAGSQPEIDAIAMQILREQGGDFQNTVMTGYSNGGAPAAYQQMSPAVQQRIRELANKMQRDPSFNQQNAQRLMPTHIQTGHP